MVAVIGVLASLLAGALVAVFAIYGRIGNVERKYEAQKSRADGLRKEADYWIGRTLSWERRYRAADAGLTRVQALATGKMANVGHRMYQAAANAQQDAKRLPFDK